MHYKEVSINDQNMTLTCAFQKNRRNEVEIIVDLLLK